MHNFFGTSTFADHIVSNVNNVAKIDPDVDISLFGPCGCGFMTGSGAVLGELKPEPGGSMVVFGLGSVGLGSLMGAKITGCTTIIAVDTVDSRLDLALQLGTTHVINSKKIQDVPAEIVKITNGGAVYACECSAAGICVHYAYACTRWGASIAIVGVSGHVDFDGFFFETFPKNTVTIEMGDVDPKYFIPEMVEWYKLGLFPIDKLFTYYTIGEINEAMADGKSGKTIKPIIRFN